eukprot:12199519-Ditylum_brightwellii.AAC.1
MLQLTALHQTTVYNMVSPVWSYQKWLVTVHNCAQREELSLVIIIRRLGILQHHKISETTSKSGKGGQMRYLIV